MKVVIWSKPACSFCDRAKSLLKMKNIEFEEKKIGSGYSREDLLEAVPNARTVPQIFIDNQLIGGYQELTQYLKEHDGA